MAQKTKNSVADELRKKTHALDERIKELHCVYGVSKLADQYSYSLDKLLQKVTELIPPGWQYPPLTCARITVENEDFFTPNFKKTAWRQVAPIRADQKTVGTVEVYYLRKMPMQDEGPFLKEERSLINAIAEQLGKSIERIRREEALRISQTELLEQKNALEQKNIALREILGQLEAEKRQIKERILANIEKLIIPRLNKLRITGASKKYADLIHKDLENLTSSFGQDVGGDKIKLSPREIEICGMIKNGMTSKEIAKLMNITPYTVEKHRFHIRRKLNMLGKSVNLISYLRGF